MDPILKQLLLGALKSGVSALCALIVALPMVDPMKFSLASIGGWAHIGEVSLAVIVVAEARYWLAWASGK
jgi:hypothetical protein